MPVASHRNDEKSTRALTSANICRGHIKAPAYNRVDEWIDNVIPTLESFTDQGALSPAALLQNYRLLSLLSHLMETQDRISSLSIAILRQLLTPRLRATVVPSIYIPNPYGQTLVNLRRSFGSVNRIIDTYVKNSLDIPPMKSSDRSDVDKFFYEVHGAINSLRAYCADADLSSRTTLQAVASIKDEQADAIYVDKKIIRISTTTSQSLGHR
ncbi:hypothetical protein TTRE_0000666401 [Trichuris trichiura]|uniref:Uncharacterized protein n=1 Tax=Trichuris trichiura TaxID=36087 RepID=A0A077ZES7_TRITR|nr:hypothetical protein TTRE_0000666401 [Trichuris trichiura]